MKNLSNGVAEGIVELLPYPLLILDTQLHVKAANRSFYQTFHTTNEDTEQRFLFDVANGAWNIPTLRTNLERAHLGDNLPQAFEIDHLFPVIGRKQMVINFAAMPAQDSPTPLILLTFNDVTTVRQAQEKARLNKQLLAAVGQAIIAVDQQGMILHWNQAAESLYGWPAMEVLGRPLGVLALTADESSLADMALLFQGAPFSGEYPLRRRDGTRFQAFATVTPILDDEDRQIGIVGIAKDITKQKQAEEALRDSEARFRSFFDLPLVGVAYTSVEKGVLRVNEKLCELLGYRHDEMLQLTWPQLTHPSDLEVDVVQFNRVMAGETDGYSIDKRFLRKDGQTLYTIMTTRALRDSLGKVTHFVSLVQDITERKQAEETTKQLNRNLESLLVLSRQSAGHTKLNDLLHLVARTILDTLPHAESSSVWLFDGPQKPLTLHAWAIRDGQSIEGFAVLPSDNLAEYISDHPMSQNIDDVAADLAERFPSIVGSSALRSVLGAPLSAEDQSLGILTAGNASRHYAFDDGDLRWLKTLAAQAGTVIRNVQLFEQVVAGQERMRQLAQQVVSAQEDERGRVSRELHDEIGQALTFLKMSLQLIDQDLPEACAFLRQPITGVIMLVDETVQQLRELSLDLHPPALDAMELNDLLQSYCEDFAEHSHLSVEYVGTVLAPVRNMTKTYLYRLLQEALTNVVKHAHARHIWVRLTADAATIDLSIADDGQGFDTQIEAPVPGQLRHLGLPNMRERLRLLGGWIDLDSQPGQGTRVVAHLPREEA